MFKKKFSNGLFIIFALVLFLFLSPQCLANLNNSTLQDLYDNLQVLQDRGLLSQDFMQNFSFTNPYWGTEYIILITNESVDNVYIAYGYNGTKIINNGNDWKTDGTTVTNVGAVKYKNKNVNNNGRNLTSWGGFPGNNYTYVYAYSPYYEIDTNALQLDAGAEFGDNYLTGPVTTFIPNKDYIVTFDNHNNVNALLRNYSVNQWQIGDTDNFDVLPAFQFYLNDLTLGYRVGNVHYYSGYGLLYDGLSYDGALFYRQDNLYVNARYINYKHLYELIVSKTYDGNETLEYYYYVFLPRDAVISNGAIISSGSGDYSVQNSTNDIIDNENDLSAVEDLQAELLESGELIKRLDYRVYPNHSYDIIFALTQNIVDTLYYSGDTYIDISIGDRYSHRFYASDFSIPINGLTYWIYMALTFGYCYLLYKQGAQLIHAIQEGDLMVLELEDADEYFYM